MVGMGSVETGLKSQAGKLVQLKLPVSPSVEVFLRLEVKREHTWESSDHPKK